MFFDSIQKSVVLAWETKSIFIVYRIGFCKIASVLIDKQSFI